MDLTLGANDTADESNVDRGQGLISPLNDDFSSIFNNHLYSVKEEILKYLDGSALINLSLVNKEFRQLVTSSPQYKMKVNLRVKTVEFFTREPLPVAGWTTTVNSVQNLTLVCDSKLKRAFMSQKFSSLALTLPNLSTLEIINDLKSYSYAQPTLDKILNLCSNLKSLSIPYEFMLNPINFDHAENLKELKFTTSTYKVKPDIDHDIDYGYDYGDEENLDFHKNFENFDLNLNNLSTKCINLKSFTCQELEKVAGRYDDSYEEENHKFFNGLLTIIEKYSQNLVKLEFGISQLLSNPEFSSKFIKISLPNLQYLDLRLKTTNPDQVEPPVLDIINNLVQPGQLTTLKLTLTIFPTELFDLIPREFPQLKCLSLKSSKFTSTGPDGRDIDNDECWSFLQSLGQLEELEITQFILCDQSSNFGREISDKFPDFLGKNLRKLSLKVTDNYYDEHKVRGSTFFNGIAKLNKLNELVLTGCCLSLEDFLSICTNLKFLEKFEISHLHADNDFHHDSLYYCTRRSNYNKMVEIDSAEIITAFLSLKCLKNLFIDFWDGDFRKVLGSNMEFPYLKRLSLCNAKYLGENGFPIKIELNYLENIIKLNGMLKVISIVTLKRYCKYDEHEVEEIEYFENERNARKGLEGNANVNERKNLKLYCSTKQYVTYGMLRGEARDDLDPDSRPLNDQNTCWSPREWDYMDI